MAYKKLIKVSNVCQLLDKSKFPATLTRNGITWTNNGDGTITANGTLTINAYSSFDIASNIQIVKGHKYALLGGQGDKNIIGNLILRNINQSDYDGKWWYVSTRTNWIGVAPASFPAKSWMDFGNAIGSVADNITFKPQLFDLTEMYGAGNEPTSVEQFRQDFPEEMYDYSPYCWLTSYKRVFMTKTKNLFDINSAKKVSGISFSKNGNQITASQTRAEKWKSANVLLDTSLIGKTITVTANAMTDGINKTYIRIQWTANNGLAGGRSIEGNMISGNSYKKITLSGVVPEKPDGDFNNLCIMFYSNTNAALESGVTYSATFTNIQIELGDTATDYVPYGYLTTYQRNLTCKTKNLFDINSVSNINNWVTSVSSAHPYGYYTFYLKPNTTYTFSRRYASNNNEVYACFSKKYGVADDFFIHPTSSSLVKDKLSFTTDDTGIMYLNVYGIRSVMNSFIELIEGAQLEEGSNTTDYVPYGHL